jgi:uncharacterized protein YoxC
MQRVARSVEDRRAQVSLHLKILAGYVTLAAALVAVFYVGSAWDWVLKIVASFLVTLVLAVVLPYFVLRVGRVRVLSATALEISRGDLSRAVQLDASSVRDDIDELAVAISDMQANLRELVSSIQHTAESVAESAAALGGNVAGVNAQASEVGESMKAIAAGAEAQSVLVGRATRTITDMAQALQRTSHSASRIDTGRRSDLQLGRRRQHRRHAWPARRCARSSRASKRPATRSSSLARRRRRSRKSSTPSPRSRSRRTCWRSTPPSRPRAPASTAAASRWSPTKCASWLRAPGKLSRGHLSLLARDISPAVGAGRERR